MAYGCVVLASRPHGGEEAKKLWPQFQAEFEEFEPGVVLEEPFEVELCEYGDQDGGNGGGGEPGGQPLRASIGLLRRTFWDFKYNALKDAEEWRDRYVNPLRFEVCIPFEDIVEAATFLHSDSRGQLLGQIFSFVQIVAFSTPKKPI